MAYEDEEDLNYDDYENEDEDEEYTQNHHKNYNYDDDFYEMEIKNEQNP
ncbi:highly acidic protein [Campylobacter jejuni]